MSPNPFLCLHMVKGKNPLMSVAARQPGPPSCQQLSAQPAAVDRLAASRRGRNTGTGHESRPGGGSHFKTKCIIAKPSCHFSPQPLPPLLCPVLLLVPCHLRRGEDSQVHLGSREGAGPQGITPGPESSSRLERDSLPPGPDPHRAGLGLQGSGRSVSVTLNTHVTLRCPPPSCPGRFNHFLKTMQMENKVIWTSSEAERPWLLRGRQKKKDCKQIGKKT